MSKSQEDVLLIVSNVKNKKCEGFLYMMSERMAWMPSGKDSFTVSHRYADIKTQKISPDTKDKIQLQVVFTAGGANTFHFNNPGGRSAQIADRDAVKELLQQMLPRFKPKINNELAEKNRLLQTDPDLFRLYKELVVTEMMTSDEFWASRTNKLKSNQVEKDPQDVGVSAAFLADIRGQADGCNGVKYNVTADVIKSIFRTYPTVQQKHLEFVPDHMTEEDFWTQFFQSHYFHRDRINLTKEELFADCAKQDDKMVEIEIAKVENNPLINLTAMSDYTVVQDDSNRQDCTDTTSQINKSLIKRFNQHSTMVLKTCDKKRRVDNNGSRPVEENFNGVVGGNAKQPTLPESSAMVEEGSEFSKRAKLKELIDLTDLKDEPSGYTGSVLKLAKRDPYLHGPTPVIGTQYTTGDELLNATQAFTHDILAWSSHNTQVMPSSAATSVLFEMAPGGCLMQNCSVQQINLLASSEVASEAKILYNALAELLRHFWTCFPVTSKELEDKAVRMNESLQRFHKNKLLPFSSKHYNNNLTSHLEKMLEVALKKFEVWQSKKLSKRT